MALHLGSRAEVPSVGLQGTRAPEDQIINTLHLLSWPEIPLTVKGAPGQEAFCPG